MDEKQVLSISDAVKFLAISKATLYRYRMNDSSFPKSIHLTKRKIVYRIGDLIKWIDKKAEETNAD